jgi:hypothetical protein
MEARCSYIDRNVTGEVHSLADEALLEIWASLPTEGICYLSISTNHSRYFDFSFSALSIAALAHLRQWTTSLVSCVDPGT